VSDAADLFAMEADAVSHMNDDHREALQLYATRLAVRKRRTGEATGLDPEGLDLAAGDLTTRLTFRRRVLNPGDLRRHLKELADEARTMPAQEPRAQTA
jgi:putative heme iron utilization protein